MEDTRLKDIFMHLKKRGFEVYLSGIKTGECTSKYVVVKESVMSQVPNRSSVVQYYDVLCYVPQNTPSQLALFLDEAAECMKGLQPMIMPTYQRTEPFFDDSVKAYMSSMTYRNYRKI